MQKFQLDWDIECDFELYGVASHVGSHRLGWELNRIFDWELSFDRMIEDNFIVLRYINIDDDLDIALILNRVPDGILASGAASFDYLLRVRDGLNSDLNIIKKMRSSNLVTLVTSIVPENSGALEELFELD